MDSWKIDLGYDVAHLNRDFHIILGYKPSRMNKKNCLSMLKSQY